MLRRKPYMIRGESRADYEVTMPRGRRMLKRCSVGPLVRGASACLAIGIFNKKFYQDYAVQEERIVMAPYSVDNDFFQMGDHERRDVRVRVLSELGMDPTKPTVLFAAKMVTWKRPEDVLLACQNLKSEVNILMVGAGPILADLKSRYAVTTNIAFLGFLNQQALRNYYAAADVFVLPSDFEPWGLGVNEAMAAGCYPIVSSAVGCAPDLVEPSTSALFPPGDVDKLAQLLGEAIEQLGDREWAVRCRGVIDAHGIESTARGIELGTLASLKGV
jgi:glycosyltransferase involved in cell wall biosynthesis